MHENYHPAPLEEVAHETQRVTDPHISVGKITAVTHDRRKTSCFGRLFGRRKDKRSKLYRVGVQEEEEEERPAKVCISSPIPWVVSESESDFSSSADSFEMSMGQRRRRSFTWV